MRGASGQSEREALLSTPQLNFGKRKWQDVGALVCFVLLFVGTLACGAFAWTHRNRDFADKIQPSYLNVSSHCPMPPPLSDQFLGAHAAAFNTMTSYVKGRRALLGGLGEEPPFRLDLFWRQSRVWLLATAAGSLVLGLSFLLLLRAAPGALVISAIALQVALPAVGAGAAFLQGSAGLGIPLLLLSGMTALMFAVWAQQIGLVTRLLSVSVRALYSNPGLIVLSLGLQVALGLLFLLPLGIAAGPMLMNGDVAPNPFRDSAKPDECVNTQGDAVLCCIWQVNVWAAYALYLVYLSAGWSIFLVFEIKVFVVAGAVAQWYFFPTPDSSNQDTEDGSYRASGWKRSSPAGAAGDAAAPGAGGSRTLRSLGHALGPNLGSLCFGSAVLSFVSLLRSAMEKARREANNSLLWACASACMGFLFSVLEFLTKFTTVQMALTGETFLDSGRSVVQLLRRNALDAFGVWWLPSLLLQSMSFILSTVWGITVYWSTYAMWHNKVQGPTSAILVGVAAFLTAWLVLAFLMSVLLNVVDALFICFAIDRDAGQCSLAEVHEVYASLPTVGQVVQHPDDSLGYAAPPPPTSASRY